MNPILPPFAFVPDGEPRVFDHEGEKRVYLYGSRDERITDFCGYGHDVWSAPVNNLNSWTCHGEAFNVEQVMDIGYGKVPEQHFGAPDCVYNPISHKYYLYTFLGKLYQLDDKEGPLKDLPNTVPGFDRYGPKCVMAQSYSPTGPFTDPVMCDWPAGNREGTFDPGVLVDQQDDGSIRVYAYWGMKDCPRCAEIDPLDMHTIINPQTRKPDRNAWRRTLPSAKDNHNSVLFEANSIRKVAKNKYVFIYSAVEKPSALTYCYGKSPFGPWSYGGRIIDNRINWPPGNNHGSIAQINGQWYVFYHRQTCDDYNRQAMMEPIDLRIQNDHVVIPEVEMTSQGCNIEGLNPFRPYNISTCCYINHDAYINGKKRDHNGLNPMVDIRNGTALGMKYLNLSSVPKGKHDFGIRFNIQIIKSVTVSILLIEATGGSRFELGHFSLSGESADNDNFDNIVLPLEIQDFSDQLNFHKKNKWALFIRFSGTDGELCRIKEFEFLKDFSFSDSH